MFLGFCEDAANELHARLPRHIEARTVHSLARRTLYTHLRRQGVKLQAPDDGKYRAFVKSAIAEVMFGFALPKEEFVVAEAYLLKLVKFARYNLTQTKNEDEVRALAVHYNLIPPQDAKLEVEMHQKLPVALRQGHDLTVKYGLIDYIDMLYLPWVLKPNL